MTQPTPQQQADALRYSLAVNDGRCPKCDVELTGEETLDAHFYWMHHAAPGEPVSSHELADMSRAFFARIKHRLSS